MFFKDPKKEIELGVGSLDFGTNKKQFVTEIISKDYLKNLTKTYVPFDKAINEVGFGVPDYMVIKYINEVDNKLLIAYAANVTEVYNRLSRCYEGSLVFNSYNQNLQKKFIQVLPSNNMHVNFTMRSGFHVVNNLLYVIANSAKHSNAGLMGVLDVTTGKWNKMNYLSKKHFNNDDFIEGSEILWYGNTILIPYVDPRGFFQQKFNITLQQNQY